MDQGGWRTNRENGGGKGEREKAKKRAFIRRRMRGYSGQDIKTNRQWILNEIQGGGGGGWDTNSVGTVFGKAVKIEWRTADWARVRRRCCLGRAAARLAEAAARVIRIVPDANLRIDNPYGFRTREGKAEIGIEGRDSKAVIPILDSDQTLDPEIRKNPNRSSTSRLLEHPYGSSVLRFA